MKWSGGLVSCLMVALLVPVGMAGPLDGDDDAGSGQDAPASYAEAWSVEAGEVHHGDLAATTELRDLDVYRLETSGGSMLQVRFSAEGRSCYGVYDLTDARLAYGCNYPGSSHALELELPVDEVYLRINPWVAGPDSYSFAYAVDGEAPPMPTVVDALPPTPPLPFVSDDAGSGKDAPRAPVPDVVVTPGHVYQANLTGAFVDNDDFFAFEAAAGQRLAVRVDAVGVGCVRITDENGTSFERTAPCNLVPGFPKSVSVTAPYNGTYYVHYSFYDPVHYQFSIGIDDVPVDPSFVPLLTDANETWPGPVHTPSDQENHAVVGFLDSGINPYHETFRDTSPQAQQYPGTYIPDYPEDAIALDLSLDAPDYQSAIEADCAIWASVEPGVLYWIPGTKIIGAMFLDDTNPPDRAGCEGGVVSRGILDEHGHGTMVASRGASFEYGACKACKIVVVSSGMTASFQERKGSPENTWLAEQAQWIDAQSNSWGPIVRAPLVDGLPQKYFGMTPSFLRAVEDASSAHLAFWSSGNGAAGRFGGAGHPTTFTHHTPSAIVVGGHDSGTMNTWPGMPAHVVSDSCQSWAAYSDSMSRSASTVGGGTSGAAPFAAGGAAAVLLEARQILDDPRTGVHDGIVASGTPPAGLVTGPLADGVFTLDEWREVVFKTASERPERQLEDGPTCDALWVPYQTTPIMWRDVPEAYPEYVQIGYGAVDRDSLALAGQVLGGEVLMPDRSDTDTFFAVDHTARQVWYDTYGGL